MPQPLFIQMSLQAWHGQIKRADQFFQSLTDEQLMQPVAPNRNRGVYLLGHLAATHDDLLDLFGLRKMFHPEWHQLFVKESDNTTVAYPSVTELRAYWKEANEELAKHINALSEQDWFQRHTRVSEEDFAKEPHRNKLNVLMGRTAHVAYHMGQIIFLKPR